MSRPFTAENAFRALSHVRRRVVVESLARRDLTPAEMCQAMRISGPALSQHLRTLRQSGLVVTRRRGSSLVYRLNRARLGRSLAWLARIHDPASIDRRQR